MSSMYCSVPDGKRSAVRVAVESPEQPEVVALIAELDAYQNSLYPAESCHLIDMAELKRPNVVFAVARNAQREAIGCGAVVLGPAYAELKRMFVRPHLRGQGVAKALLAMLEDEAARRGCSLLRLETGIGQPEALGFYDRAGYTRRGPFGEYTNDPLSVFMQKRLGR